MKDAEGQGITDNTGFDEYERGTASDYNGQTVPSFMHFPPLALKSFEPPWQESNNWMTMETLVLDDRIIYVSGSFVTNNESPGEITYTLQHKEVSCLTVTL